MSYSRLDAILDAIQTIESVREYPVDVYVTADTGEKLVFLQGDIPGTCRSFSSFHDAVTHVFRNDLFDDAETVRYVDRETGTLLIQLGTRAMIEADTGEMHFLKYSDHTVHIITG